MRSVQEFDEDSALILMSFKAPGRTPTPVGKADRLGSESPFRVTIDMERDTSTETAGSLSHGDLIDKLTRGVSPTLLDKLTGQDWTIYSSKCFSRKHANPQIPKGSLGDCQHHSQRYCSWVVQSRNRFQVRV